MRRLLLHQCRLLPQTVPSHVDCEITVQRSCKQFYLLFVKKSISTSRKKIHDFSDSLSTLHALGKLKTDHPLLIQIQELLHKINTDHKEIVFMWVTGHVRIQGNEAADRAAKEALNKKER